MQESIKEWVPLVWVESLAVCVAGFFSWLCSAGINVHQYLSLYFLLLSAFPLHISCVLSVLEPLFSVQLIIRVGASPDALISAYTYSSFFQQ